jgi:hypothetical protein
MMFWQTMELGTDEGFYRMKLSANALSDAYMGNTPVSGGPAAFVVPFDNLQTDIASGDNQGLPTFTANIAGVVGDAQYYYINLNNENTLVFDDECYYDNLYSCSKEPVNANTTFNASSAPELVEIQDLVG